MGALKIGTTKRTVSEGRERREVDGARAAYHKIKTSANASDELVTIKRHGENFHMPSTMTDRSEPRAQSNTSTCVASASRTMPLVCPPPHHQQQQQQQPHNTIKLSHLSPTSSAAVAMAAAAAQQPSYNNNNNSNHNPHHHHHHSFIKTTTTNTSTTTAATTTTAASLVYQIVIISLILHELPPLSSSTSSYQTTSCCRGGLVAASLHSPAASANQQRQSAGGHVEPRHKRHLAAAAATAASHEKQVVDCHRLTSMWQYLHTSYPALASHLLEWSSQTTAGKQADERFLWARSTQAARSIGQLLEEAERLTASSASGKRPAASGDGDSEHQRQLAGAAWLTRVTANPAYARLVQHLRAKQMQQQQHKHSSVSSGGGESSGSRLAGAGNGSGSGNGNGNDDEPTSTGAEHGEEPADGGGGEQMAVAASSAAGPGATYGRLVHYPHEIGNTDNSHGMARTLDKLRLLSHHNRQQQQQQQQQNGVGGGGDRDIEETNRIPLATDVDQMTESDWRRLSESATDAARQNFVYGQVLLRPTSSQAHQSPQQDSQQQQQQQSHHHHYQRPLEVLQGVQHEQERQRVAAAAGGGHETAPPSGSGSQTLDTGLFGRIVSGPQITDAAGNNNNNDKSAQHKHAATLAEQRRRQQQVQRMDELRAASSESDYRVANGGGGGDDELANQQRFQTMAVVETRPSESNSGGDADFDELGVFHNSPLDKPEVRLLRSAPAQQPPEPVLAKTGNNLNFVVD